MARRSKHHTRQARILLVEDDRDYAEATRLLLQREGHEVSTVPNGSDALDFLSRQDVDLVLLDYVMPGMTGDVVVKHLRTFNDHVQVILQTGYATEHPPRALLHRLDIQGYHDKSDGPEKLLMWVDVGIKAAQATNILRNSREGLRHILNVTPGLHRLQSLVELLQGTLLQISALVGSSHSFLAVCEPSNDSGPGQLTIRASTGRFEGQTSVAECLSGAAIQSVFAAMQRGELQIVDGSTILPLRVGPAVVGIVYLDHTVEDVELLKSFASHAAAAIHSSQLLETEREQAEAALRISEERHRILFDASPLPIWVFDPKTLKILAVNDALVRLIGYSRAELLTMRVPDLNPQDSMPWLVDLPPHPLLPRRGGAGGNGVREPMHDSPDDKPRHVGTMAYLCKDRRFIELDVTSHVTMLDGSPVMLALGVDVTHSKKIEEQLRQSQKMEAVGQLAGGVAHDFNNIIAVILGSTDWLIEELGKGHPLAVEVREVEAAAHRAAALTRQLLTFSRQQRRKVEVVQLNAVVAWVEKMLTRVLGEDIEMSTVLSPDLWAIEADVGQLEQVLMNLVVNARDAMPTGGNISIETSNAELDEEDAGALGVPPGSYVKLSVSDTGVGMDADTKAHVFEPFFTTKEIGRGTGLGLSTVFGIVQQSGGAVDVTSAPGQGARFCIYLPRHDNGEEIRPGTAAPAVVVSGSGQRVLLVEDDDRLRAIVARQLRSWGYRLIEARNGSAALELLKGATESIDLLLTDLVMPGIDGRSLANQVLASCPHTKVLFMSGHTHHPSVKTPLDARERFIEKPFSARALSTALCQALEDRRGD